MRASPDADLRARVVTAALEAFRQGEFHTVGADEVARAAQVDRTEVCRLYPVWELLLVAVTDRVTGTSRRELWHVAEDDGTVAYLRAVLEARLTDPALVRLRVALLSAASNPAHAAAGWFRAQYTRMYEDLTLALVRDVVAGREPRGMQPRHAAEQLLALFEGLQLQAMLRDDTDLLGGYDQAVARMRVGWRAAAAEPGPVAPTTS